MIRSFRCEETRKVFEGDRSRRLPPDIQQVAHRKLLLMDAAGRLDDLRMPPGNRLEVLAGNRSGQHSLRINRQWRICFNWADAHAENVEIVDYH